MSLPIDLYTMCRRISDKIDPGKIINNEIPEKYGKANPQEIFEGYARLTATLNPSEYDSQTASDIEKEQNILRKTAKKNGFYFDEDTPATPEEISKAQRFKNYVAQKTLFRGSRNGEREKMATSHVSDDDIKLLQSVSADDPDLSYFDDMGKHLYAEHGWCKGNFERHPTPESRDLAHEIEHHGLMGSVKAPGATYFDELAKPFANGNKIPVLGKVAPNMMRAHMKVLHGYPGTEEDHKRDHMNGLVGNHTHDITDFE